MQNELQEPKKANVFRKSNRKGMALFNREGGMEFPPRTSPLHPFLSLFITYVEAFFIFTHVFYIY